MNDFNYSKAQNTSEAISKISSVRKSEFIAGGTNIIDLYKYNIANPDLLVDINGLEECKTIRELENGGVRIGALVSNADTAYHTIIEERYPLLSKAILSGASGQIRNMATNGGNLLQRTRCYYFYDTAVPCNKRNPGSGCAALNGYNRIHAILGANDQCIAVFPSDMCIALAALDATVNVTGPDGDRVIPFSEFHRLPGDSPEKDNNLKKGELITSIDLPPEGFNQHYSYVKLRDRHSYAFALVSVATIFNMEENLMKEVRIALGGVAHKPWRVREAEDFLTGKKPDKENFSAAADILLKGARTFQYNDFKLKLAKEAIIRNGAMALKPESQLPGAQPANSFSE